MLRSTLSSGRIATRLLGQASQYNFCWGMGLLDPRKHTTMNHNPNNMYIDLWDYGQYPDWWHNHSIAPRTYEPQVANILLNTLNQRYVTPMPCRDSTSPPGPLNQSQSGVEKVARQRPQSQRTVPRTLPGPPQQPRQRNLHQRVSLHMGHRTAHPL